MFLFGTDQEKNLTRKQLNLKFMKRLSLLTVLVFAAVAVSAQFSNNWLADHNNHLLYTNFDLMMGTNAGGNVGMSFVYNSKYSVQVGYSSVSNNLFSGVPGLKSKEKSGTGTAETAPRQIMENFNVMFGRHFNLNHNGSLRFILQGGPGMSVILNSVGPDNMVSFADKMQEFSLMVNTKIEIPIIDMLGFSAGPTLVMNQERQDLTFCVGFIYGITTTN